MAKGELYNHSKERYEECIKILCPRCKGYGSVTQDDGEPCILCKGYGNVWQSIEDKAWFRAIYQKKENSQAW